MIVDYIYIIRNALATIKNLIDKDSFCDMNPDTDEIEQLRKSLDIQIVNEIKLIENACGGKQNSDKSDKPVDVVNSQELDAYNFIDK